MYKIIKEKFYILFCAKSWKSTCILHDYSISEFRPGTFPVVSCHVQQASWQVVTLPASAPHCSEEVAQAQCRAVTLPKSHSGAWV